ncbi:hypothetical protein [Geothrix sp. 21YS21S-4]|uniref:hypothetical protein n=1 Tax=Geothrix sp. 21YS21S-4 TaxID=3068889 RepID=UPI0027BA911E|nr:hypothetical protein [Geothrix sp. 21YS21S-4]
MRDYIHHIPGRLRIKGAGLRQPQRHLEALRALEGVESATFNAAAGSLLITYVPAEGRGEWILNEMVAMGVLAGRPSAAKPAAPPKLASLLFKTLAGEVVGKRIPMGLGKVLIALV